jgi:hypothetical protein
VKQAMNEINGKIFLFYYFNLWTRNNNNKNRALKTLSRHFSWNFANDFPLYFYL